LKELVTWPDSAVNPVNLGKGRLAVIGENLKDNWFEMVMKQVAVTVGFRYGKKLLRKPINMSNKLLKMGGLGSTIKV